MQRLRMNAPAQTGAENTSPHLRDRTRLEPKQTREKEEEMSIGGSAMLWGRAEELNLV